MTEPDTSEPPGQRQAGAVDLGGLARHAPVILIATLALAAGGVYAGTRLPSGIYPEIEFPRIVVVAHERDVPPAEAQKSLTRPLENALATVMGVERIRSRTIRGSVEMSLQFAPGTDMWRALQLTESRVAEARPDLPPTTEVNVERLTTTSFPVVTFNLSGDTVDPRRLRELADLVLRPALSRIHGVGRIEVLGGDVREVEIVLDPDRLAGLGLRPTDVVERVRASTVLQAVGRFDEARALVTVMASAEPRRLADLERVPVTTAPDGTPVPLSAVARVFEGAEDRTLRVGGPRGETVLVSVSRLPGASTPDVVEQAERLAAEVAAGFPAGVRLEPVYDQAALVRESMRTVRDAIGLGIGLCVLVIGLFLRDVRAGLIAAVAVPLTLAISLLVAALCRQSLNLMSLGGLAVAIGLVIDDAIVVVESIGRRLEQGDAPAVAAVIGPRALFAALVGTTLTTVVVLVPLAWLAGIVGEFFTALAVTLGAAVILSLGISLTVIPWLSGRWLRPVTTARRRARLVPGYVWLLRRGLRLPGLPVLAALGLLGLLGLGWVAASRVPSGFLPTMDEGAFVLDYFLPAGTSLTETDRVARKIEAVLRANPDVETYARRTGAELGPIAATQVSRGDFMVRLKAGRASDHDIDRVITAVRARVAAEVPEARTEFVQVLQDVLNDLAGIPRPIEVKVFGDDDAVLRRLAEEITRRVADVPGLVDLYPGFEEESPELRFRIDAAEAARFGKTASDVAADLETSLRGTSAGVFRRSVESNRPLNLRVRYPDAIRFAPEAVASLAWAWPSPGAPGASPAAPAQTARIPVSVVAPLERVGVATVLRRENLRGVVAVTGDHEGRDLGAVVRDIRARLRGLALPEGYRLELGGQYESQQQTTSELTVVIGFGLVAVLVVLVAQFRRVRHALLVLGTAPLALVGALATLWIAGVPLNASSLMGCVLLVGLVVKNGILLLEQFELLAAGGLTVDEALIEAGARRVRPILMTTIATLAGLLPLVLGLGAGSEIQRPLAVAVIGGLSLSTMVSLLVLPVLVRVAWARSGRGGRLPPSASSPTPRLLGLGLGLVLILPSLIVGGCVPGAGGGHDGTGTGGAGGLGHPSAGSASGGATGAASGSGGRIAGADAALDLAADTEAAAADAGASLPEAGVDRDGNGSGDGNGDGNGNEDGGSGGATRPGWSLVWSDEFSVDGPPDPASWRFETGFVRNVELQWYQAPNAAVAGGVLTIEGRRERVPNPGYQAGSADWRTSRAFADYTSASITTAGKRTFTYGRFEARARIDVRQGSWPAFWTLGTTGGWPGGGEVDIMEFYASKVLANVCRPAGGTCTWSSGIQTLAELGPDWPSQFHVWAMEWDATRIDLFLDGKSTNHFVVADAAGPGAVNPYVARPVYLLLNLALGANGGDPTGTTFPVKYEIDYVRVYQRTP